MRLRDPNANCAIYDSSSYGPIFGGGHDLMVYDNDVTLNLNVGTTYDGCATIGTYVIKEIEVYQVSECKVTQDSNKPAAVGQVVRFSEDINEAINTKIKSLAELETEIKDLEESFNDEQSFITSFTSGDTKDVVALNVNGTIMATKRATLCTLEESSLAQQFDDTKWTEQGLSANHRVKGRQMRSVIGPTRLKAFRRVWVAF